MQNNWKSFVCKFFKIATFLEVYLESLKFMSFCCLITNILPSYLMSPLFISYQILQKFAIFVWDQLALSRVSWSTWYHAEADVELPSANKYLNKSRNVVHLVCLPKWACGMFSSGACKVLSGILNSNPARALGFTAANSKGQQQFHMQKPHLKPPAAALCAPVVISGSNTAVCWSDLIHSFIHSFICEGS